MNQRPILECRGLEVYYGSLGAVRGVSLEAKQGEILGLLGPNGAGKTSVIRALTTIVAVTAGSAMIAGHALDDPVAVRSVIGVLPESNGYPGAQTGLGYLRFYGRLHGLSSGEAKARGQKLLEQFGLGEIRRPIGSYSRGMRQRLGLCRAMINRPDVLFLDEPTLGLDPAGKEEIMTHLTRTAIDDGTCVILCSHLLDEVERVCDRVAVMHQGRIVVSGTVDHVIATSGVTGSGRVTVRPDELVRAAQVLEATPVGPSLRYDNNRPGDIELDLAETAGAGAEVLRALLDAGIEPGTFDLRGARLSDAFLALTEKEMTS